MSLLSVNLLHLTESKNSPDTILKLMVTTRRSKIKSRSHHNVAHLQPKAMSRASISFLHITVSEIQPRQDFKSQGHYGTVKGQIKVAP